MKYVCVLATLMLAACVGETSTRSPVNSGDGGPQQPATDGAGPACSASGVPASCDPVTGDGCGTGRCYLVKDKGPCCVCPGGTAAEGDSCNTTTDCAAGLVCAGTSPPGVCRRTCRPSTDKCSGGETCRFINAFPIYGYCDEQ
jgi:hypothetical protein